MTRRASTGALLAVLTWAPVALGETPEERAKVLFEEARHLSDQGKWAEACPKFREAHELFATGGTGLLLATCYEKVGNLQQALYHYEKVRDNAADKNEDRKRLAGERARELASKLAGEAKPAAPVPVAGVPIAGVPSPPPSAPLAPSREPPRAPSLVPGLTVLGASVAVGAVGAVLGGLAVTEMRGVWATCAQQACPLEQKPVADAALAKATGADVAFVTAGAAAVVGVVLLVRAAVGRPAPTPLQAGLESARFTVRF